MLAAVSSASCPVDSIGSVNSVVAVAVDSVAVDDVSVGSVDAVSIDAVSVDAASVDGGGAVGAWSDGEGVSGWTWAPDSVCSGVIHGSVDVIVVGTTSIGWKLPPPLGRCCRR